MILCGKLKVSIYNGLSFIDLEILVNWYEKHRWLKMILPFRQSDSTVTVENLVWKHCGKR